MSDRLPLDAKVHHDQPNRVTILVHGVEVGFVDVSERQPYRTLRDLDAPALRQFHLRAGGSSLAVDDERTVAIGHAGATTETVAVEADPAWLFVEVAEP